MERSTSPKEEDEHHAEQGGERKQPLVVLPSFFLLLNGGACLQCFWVALSPSTPLTLWVDRNLNLQYSSILRQIFWVFPNSFSIFDLRNFAILIFSLVTFLNFENLNLFCSENKLICFPFKRRTFVKTLLRFLPLQIFHFLKWFQISKVSKRMYFPKTVRDRSLVVTCFENFGGSFLSQLQFKLVVIFISNFQTFLTT